MRACCYAYSLHVLGISQAMISAPAPDRYPMIISATALGMLTLMVLLLAGAPLYTEDLWWHLKAGQMYFTEGPWPESDWMLHTARDDAPIQHEWLFGVSVYALEQLLGFHGLRVVHAAAVALTVWLVFSMFRRASEWPAAACFAACVFVVLAWFRLFQFRPDLVSIIGTLAGYRLLLEGEEPPSWLRVAAYALLIAVWVNFHSLFLVSLNLLIAAILGVALSAALAHFSGTADEAGRAPRARRKRLVIRLAAALLLGLFVALLNPRGVEQHLTFFSSTGNTAIWHVTDEWSHFYPFDFEANHDTITLPMWLAANAVILGFLMVAVTALVRFARLRTPEALDGFDPVRFGLGLAAIVAMLVSIRFLWMSVFPLLYVLHAFKWMDLPGRRLDDGAGKSFAVGVVLGGIRIHQSRRAFRRFPRRVFRNALSQPQVSRRGCVFSCRVGAGGQSLQLLRHGGLSGILACATPSHLRGQSRRAL
jgi:hypothetical protein